jgi:hypothetical protein
LTVPEEEPMTTYTLSHGVWICTLIESVAPRFGFHTGLTGGVLYKDGPRKDIDVVLYVRGSEEAAPDKAGLLIALVAETPLTIVEDFGYVVKAQCGDMPVDLLFPHCDGEYVAPPSESIPLVSEEELK